MALGQQPMAWRRWLVAAVEAGVALGLADASVAMSRVGERLGSLRDRLLFASALAALCALVVVLGTTVTCVCVQTALRLRPSLRPRVLQAVAIAAGIAAGFALFSGTAIRRSPARPWAILATAALAAWCAQIAWSLRGRLADTAAARPATARVALASGSVALYLVHAFAYVRLYPGLHAFAATGAISLLVLSLGLRPGVRDRTREPVASLVLFTLAAGLLGAMDMMRSGSQRSLARAQAPLGTYLVQALGRVLPAPRVDAVVHDDRLANGRHFDLRGLDVVLVTVDALRADRLGAYGSTAGLTPVLDALGREGLVFDRAYCTAPHTSYSLASIMTSKYARQLALLGIALQPGVTLASELGRVGYATAGFYPPAIWTVDGDQLGELHARGFDFAYRREDYDDASSRVAEVERYLDAHPPPRRLFVWVHLFEPHEPYETHAHARCCAGDSPRDRYAGEVATVDDAIGRLRTAFRQRGRTAAWIVTADHGEEFGEHGGRFHGTTVYDEQVRVPLILAIPGGPTGRQPGPASLIDVMPTVLAGLGIARPPRLRGRDLGPMVFGDEPWDGAVFAGAGSDRMIVQGHEKLICDVSDGTCQLYDLADDRDERTNLIDTRTTDATALRGLLEGWQASQERFEREAGEVRAPTPPALVRALQGDATVARDVAALLDGADAPTARTAARALATLGVREVPVTDALARLQLRPEVALALEAGVDLALLGDPRGVQAAREALGGSDPVLARRGALGLARLGADDGVPQLAAWVADPGSRADERATVVAALAALHSPRAFPVWIALLGDAALAPRAADALGALGDAAAVDALTRTADATRYALTRRACLGALARLAPDIARVRLAAALASLDALPEPFALTDALGEPGTTLAGARGETRLAAGRVTRIAFTGPLPAGPVDVLLGGRAVGPGAITLDGRATASVTDGPFVLTVAMSHVGHTVRVTGTTSAVVTHALVVAHPP